MQDLSKQAVQASLTGNWEEAVELNTSILLDDPDNIPALNRLGRAYTELEQKDSAKEIYLHVLRVDKYNPIAARALKTLPVKKTTNDIVPSSESFIEEPGLTKNVQLVKQAGRDILLAVNCRQPVELVPKSRLVSVKTATGQTLGCLPDDLSLRLNKLLKSGYAYQACIKSVSESQVTIFIREIKRPGRITSAPSFSRLVALKPLKKD